MMLAFGPRSIPNVEFPLHVSHYDASKSTITVSSYPFLTSNKENMRIIERTPHLD